MRIKIVNLNKVYPGGKKALKDLNLEIEPGMFGLLGPNGAGKTSLMRIMTLLQSCTSGTIYFDDYDIAKDRKAIRSLLGYLPQDFRFFEKLKTWEFLDYGAGLAGIKGKQQPAIRGYETKTRDRPSHHRQPESDYRGRADNRIGPGRKNPFP